MSAPNITHYELVNSSNVYSVGYDPDSEILQVQFLDKDKKGPGAIYRYSGVPFDVWHDFINAGSKGKYVWSHIRDRFPFVKV